MWVKQLIGRLAGSVVDVPFTVGEISIANGTAERATEEEILAAGFDPRPTVQPADLNTLPASYRVEPTEVGGFDLLDGAGLRVNDQPIHNMAAAISFAHEYQTATVLPSADQLPPDIFDAAALNARYELYRIEQFGGEFLIYDPAGVAIAGGPFQDLEAADLARHQHVAAAHGMTLEEYEATIGESLTPDDDAGGASGDTPPAGVPENWRDLPAKDRKTLAAKLAGRRMATTAEADGVLEAMSAPAGEA